MNTATVKHYIDFSAEAGLACLLIDAGWAARGTGRRPTTSRKHARCEKVVCRPIAIIDDRLFHPLCRHEALDPSRQLAAHLNRPGGLTHIFVP